MSGSGEIRRTNIEGDGGKLVTLGHVTGAHGLQGWIKVHSDTSPRENITRYGYLYLNTGGGWQRWRLKAGRRQGKYVVLKLEGCNDRDTAEALGGSSIAVERGQLPELSEAGDYYWTDLLGLNVETLQGQLLGKVDYLFETGSNDVMVIQGERERLVPFIWGEVVHAVDLDNGTIQVDWDPGF